MFKLNKKGEVWYYTIEAFEPHVKHCFSTKKGGVSKGYYESMNFRFQCDDLYENVVKNHQIMCDTIGIDYQRLIIPDERHEDSVKVVTEEDCGSGILFETKLECIDGIITNQKHVPLMTIFADCVPLYFLDPKKKVIGLAHSGWRGTVKRIAEKMIQKMIDEFNSNPEDMLVAIGPHIEQCHFVVGKDVQDAFLDEFGEEIVSFYENEYHVSLKKAILLQFRNMKIPKENITCADMCTYCNSGLLFSHRKTQGKRGNLGAIMELI